MKDFDYQYQRIEKIKKMTAFLTVVIFIILGIMLYTGITYHSSKKETSTQEIAKVEKHAVKSISEDKKLEVGEESTIKEGSYVSSDEEVATVDDSGKIIAKKEGFATIVGNNKEGSDVVVVVEVKGKANETVIEPETEQPLQEQPMVTQEEANTVENNIQTIIEEPNTNIDTPIVEENVQETNQDVVIENNTENGTLNINESEEDITVSMNENDSQEQLQQKDTNTDTKEEKVLGNWVKKIIDGKTYWYYYDEAGKAVTGWKELVRDGVKKLYYFDENGQMQKEKEIDNTSNKEEKETADDSKEETTKKKTNSADVNKLLKAAKEVTDYVRINRFSYGNAPINPAINHNAKLVSCDRCVGWALYKIGYTDQPKAYGLVVHASSMPAWLKRHNFTKITSYNNLKKGDIVFFDYDHNNDPDHVFIIGNKKSNGTWERYDCGNVTRIRSVQPTVEPISRAYFTYAYRLPEKEIEE